MTKESKYMERLWKRQRMLQVRLDRVHPEACFRQDIQQELNALNWAIGKLEGQTGLHLLKAHADAYDKLGYGPKKFNDEA